MKHKYPSWKVTVEYIYPLLVLVAVLPCQYIQKCIFLWQLYHTVIRRTGCCHFTSTPLARLCVGHQPEFIVLPEKENINKRKKRKTEIYHRVCVVCLTLNCPMFGFSGYNIDRSKICFRNTICLFLTDPMLPGL